MPTDQSSAGLPKNFLRPCVLLLLRERSAHGYELLQRLGVLGFSGDDPGGLYRVLRTLERQGLVHSTWAASQSGPARRVYEITREGMEELHRMVGTLAEARSTLGAFMSRYEEFAAVRHERGPLPSEGPRARGAQRPTALP